LEFRANVYVFAVEICQGPSTYDPLDLDACSFHILRGNSFA
jgi:hypothetical protein